MVPINARDKPIDPVELISGTLERAWEMISLTYDISANLPDMRELFEGANLSRPNQAAEKVIANMLMEVTECVSRFSPWFKMPARAYGLTSMRDRTTNQVSWRLAPEAIQKWEDSLKPLSAAIERYGGLIEAIILVDDLMLDKLEDPCVVARCSCVPPREMRIKQSILEQAEIQCELCRRAFV
ncbi:MAG TPA: hypothetical protein VFZ76_08940 [Anaerolineales bacterium]